MRLFGLLTLAESFPPEHHPLTGDWLDDFAVLHRALGPAARLSGALAEVRSMVDTLLPDRRWSDHRGVRRRVQRLVARLESIGSVRG